MTAPAVLLTREETCIRALAWRFDVPASTAWEPLFARLEAAGFVRGVRLGALERFVIAERHEVAFVTTTGRAQIRVHYTTPDEARRHTAERVLVSLLDALRADP